MSEIKNLTWEEIEQEKIKGFVRHYDWDSVVRTWAEHLLHFGVDPCSVFRTIKVQDPKLTDEIHCLPSWWKANQVEHLHRKLQYDLYQRNSWSIPITTDEINKGQLITVNNLYKSRKDLGSVCACLIYASLFMRLHSYRLSYPETWPTRPGVNEISKWAISALKSVPELDYWPYTCTYVLPQTKIDSFYKITCLHGLILYLAEEHAMSLLSYCPVILVFSNEFDEIIKREVDDQIRAETEERANQRERWRKKEEEKLEYVRKMKKLHPLWNEIDTITADELEKIIWSKPIRDVSVDFGVSVDKVRKRCKKHKIIVPSAWFWKKVEKGKLQHPNGVPVR